MSVKQGDRIKTFWRMLVSVDFESCGRPFVVVVVFFSCSIGCVFEEFVVAFGFSFVCSFWCMLDRSLDH